MLESKHIGANRSLRMLVAVRPCMRKKTIFILVVLFVLANVVWMYVDTKISDSHIAAVKAINQSEQIRKLVGETTLVIPLGSSHHLRPKAVSCGNRFYFVMGDNGFEFVRALLKKDSYFTDPWGVTRISEGYFSGLDEPC